jgi:lipopolysaccharide export system permease protein
MVVWLSSGLSLTRFIKPIAVFSTPIVLMIAFCAFVAWPWSNQQSKFLRERFQQRDDVSLLAPGQFRESTINHRVFFVEKMSPDQKHVSNVFITSTENGKVSVTVSSQGHVEIAPNGDRFIVLENGRRYDGTPGALDYHVIEFQRYGVKLESQALVDVPTASTMSTPTLVANPTPLNLGELAWRAGLPLIAINLLLLAIPLAYQNPRHNRAINLVMAVLIYLTYSNLLNVAQSWIEQGKVSFWVGLLFLHIVVALISIGMFWLRVRNQPLLPSGLWRRAAKKTGGA